MTSAHSTSAAGSLNASSLCSMSPTWRQTENISTGSAASSQMTAATSSLARPSTSPRSRRRTSLRCWHLQAKKKHPILLSAASWNLFFSSNQSLPRCIVTTSLWLLILALLWRTTHSISSTSTQADCVTPGPSSVIRLFCLTTRVSTSTGTSWPCCRSSSRPYTCFRWTAF